MSFVHSKPSHSLGVNTEREQKGEEPRITVSYPQSRDIPYISVAVKLKTGAAALSLKIAGECRCPDTRQTDHY